MALPEWFNRFGEQTGFMRVPNAPFPLTPGSAQVPPALMSGSQFSPEGAGPFVMDKSGTPLQPNAGGWRQDGGVALPTEGQFDRTRSGSGTSYGLPGLVASPPDSGMAPLWAQAGHTAFQPPNLPVQPEGPSARDLRGILFGSPQGPEFGPTQPPAQGPAQGPPQPEKPPPVPSTRPSPALAAFRASVAPQGGLGAVPMPPQRPEGLGAPQAPAGNAWDRYNESGNAADFVRANEAMGRSPQAAATNLNLGGGPMGGPGSWMPTVSRFGDLIDKDSVAGKLMQMANPRQRPGPQAAPEGLLPKLFGMWGQGQGAAAPQAGVMSPPANYSAEADMPAMGAQIAQDDGTNGYINAAGQRAMQQQWGAEGQQTAFGYPRVGFSNGMSRQEQEAQLEINRQAARARLANDPFSNGY